MTDLLLAFAAAFVGTVAGILAFGVAAHRLQRRDDAKRKAAMVRLSEAAHERDLSTYALADAVHDQLLASARTPSFATERIFQLRANRDAAIAQFAKAHKESL